MTKAKSSPRKTAAAPKPFELGTRWAAAIFALLVLVFFHDVALEGKTFVSPDAFMPAGFVRVGEQALYQEHTYPLWNPYVFLGMPSFASGAYNPLIYPPDWPLALVHRVMPLPDMTWLLLYYALGALFMFLLAREWGARSEGALLAGAAFVFAPNLVAVGSHGHGSQLVNSAYVPLLLWLTARWLRRGGLHHLGWLALAGGFQMLRGHAQIAFYTWLAVGLYLLVDLVAGGRDGAQPAVPWKLRIARAAGVGLGVALAFGLAGFYNLPLRDYASYSIRGGGADGGVGMDYATAWSMGLWELPSIVVPGAVGFGVPTYWGGMPFTDYPNAYVGMVAVVIALPALLTRGASRVFALALAVVALLISFGKYVPIYGFLYQHLPLFNKFRVPVMIIVLFQVAVALALAWGWTRILDDAEDRKGTGGPAGRVMLGASIVLALALLIGVMGQESWRGAYEKAALAKAALLERPGFSPETAQAAFRACVTDLGRVCVLGLLAAGVAVLARRRKVSAWLASLGLMGLLLADLWPVSARVMSPVIQPRIENPLEQGRDDVVEFLLKAGPTGTFRVLPFDEFQSNRFAGFGISSVGGFHAAKTRLIQDYLDDPKRVDDMKWMRLLNVRYAILNQPMGPGITPVYQGSKVVYEVAALPRVTVVGAYRVVQPAKAILDSVSRSAEDAATMTWLEKDPGLRLGPVKGASATITRYRLNDVTVEVETPGPGLLRLADLWYPDWVATVDGRPAQILKADYLLRAVPVPAGKHRVDFHFRSRAVRQGVMLSLASLTAVLGLLAVAGLQRRRAAAAGPGAI